MEVLEVNPNDLGIDPLNERDENVGPHKGQDSLEESIREQGVIQPPVARRKNGTLKVIVGQRRTLAAQAAGVEKIPVIVVDWDDPEALEASITENVDAFRKSVSKVDRAKAIKNLMEMNNWSPYDVSKKLGIAKSTVTDWVERTRDEWKETEVHVDSDSGSSETSETEVETHSENSQRLSREEVEEISDTDLKAIRNVTESSEERREAVKNVVQEGLTQSEIREAKTRAERGEGTFNEVVEKVSKRDDTEGEIQVRTEVTFTGDYAEGLQMAAREYGTSEEEIIRQAIGDYLAEEGYI